MKFKFPLFISGADPSLALLLKRPSHHASGALNSKASKSYSKIFTKYLAFVHSHRLPLSSPSPQAIVAFVEFLLAQGIKYPTIANYS